MGEHYILKGHEAVPTDLMTWARWFEKGDRIVAKDTVGEVRVSTVFLGLDHSFGTGPLLLFETMIFGGPLDGDMDRYTTWEQAEAGHAAMLAKVKHSPNTGEGK